jgi:hypothetical protein
LLTSRRPLADAASAILARPYCLCSGKISHAACFDLAQLKAYGMAHQNAM